MFRILLLFVLTSQLVLSQRYETITYGYWNNPSVWQDGLIPPYAFSDSVIINHPVAITADLEVQGYFRIESGGAICGHDNLTLYGKMEVYGFFELDSLRVDGGEARHYGPGNSVATYQTEVTNGGLFSLTGGSLAVGPWFECRNSDFFYLGYENLASDKITVKQKGDQLLISGITPGSCVRLCDLSGRMISETIAANPQLELSLDTDQPFLIVCIYENGQVLFRSLAAAGM
ncbi:MAG: hypothetical protein ACO1O6_09695 [Bacteroidota bacterium]